MSRLRNYFVQRAPLLGFCAALGIAWGACATPAASPDVEGVSAALEEKSELSVGTFVWEPSRGVVLDWLLGRGLLFEGRVPAQDEPPSDGDEPSAITTPRDIYRSFARVSPEGHVLDVSAPQNLTRTRHSDEGELRGNQEAAFFTSRAPEMPPSASLLDYAGERTPATGFAGRLQVAVSRWIETGSLGGLRRIDFLPHNPADSLKLQLAGNQLEIQLAGAGGEFSSQVSLPALHQRSSPPENLADAPLTMILRDREPGPWTHWGANIGRQLFGTGAVAWLEGRVFSTWDRLHRASYSVSHPKKAPPPAPIPLAYEDAKAQDQLWPPADITASSAQHPEDGKWRPARSKLHSQTGEPFFYRTQLHPDAKRPYAELHLVAMDMRRLELGMRAGYEDPHPDSGPPGSGRLADDESSKRVMATFNGAFKAEHGEYGMKAEGRELVQPVAGAATVVVDHAGRVGFGDWTEAMESSSFREFRQNLEALVDRGTINPHGRKVWGDHLYGEGVAVERSALCLHQSGHIVYAWATEATGLSLAAGLRAAGCLYAMHLDMNPGHCAFLFNRIDSVDPLKAEGEVLDARMQVNTTRYVRWSPKDFFFVATRESSARKSDVEWQPAPGRGPEPQSIPGILTGQLNVAGINIEIDRVAASRLDFAIEAGSAEASGQGDADGSVPLGLDDQQAARTLIAWGLGHRTRGRRTGLSSGMKVIVPLTRSFASLVLEKGAQPRLLPPAEPLTEAEGQTVVQLPLLAREGELLPIAQELGGHRTRSALCLDDDGNFYAGRIEHDTTAPLVQALLDQGCSLVAEMDRGSHPPPLVERAGTDSPPHKGYEQTLLYGLERALEPRTWLLAPE